MQALSTRPHPAQALRHRLLWPLHRWHLLSLDAPTIATLWTAAIGRAAGLHLPPQTLASMFLAVWILYAADRLLDARLLDARLLDARLLDARLLEARLLDARPLTPNPLLFSAAALSDLEARHLFHHRHRFLFLWALLPATLGLGLLLPFLAPAALHLFLLLGCLLIGYFVLIHASPAAAHLPGSLRRLPKELAVGPFFSAACFIPAIARRPQLRSELLPAALLFAALCSLNCLVIFRLEHPDPRHSGSAQPHGPAPHILTRLALRHLRSLTVSLLLAAGLLLCVGPLPSRLPALAMLVSTALLLTLEVSCRTGRPACSRLTGRALADLALATPLLLLLHP